MHGMRHHLVIGGKKMGQKNSVPAPMNASSFGQEGVVGAVIDSQIPPPPNWQGETTQVIAATIPNWLHLISNIERAGASGLRPSLIVFAPPLLRYVMRGQPRLSQQYTDTRLHLHFFLEPGADREPYATQVQEFWPPTHDLHADLNAIGRTGWSVAAVFGAEPLNVVVQRRVGQQPIPRLYNYVSCPLSVITGVTPLGDGSGLGVKTLQVVLEEEQRQGWKLACIWQHDEQQPAALIFEKDQDFGRGGNEQQQQRFTSLVLDATMVMRLTSQDQWVADFSSIDRLVDQAVRMGWHPVGSLTLPSVEGRASVGVVTIGVLLVFQAPIVPFRR